MVKIPLFPSYQQTQLFMKCIAGKKENEYRSMINSILALRGTPQEPVEWLEPEKWIPERLSGKERELAANIWEGTTHQVNPRYVRGIQYLITGYELVSVENGNFKITEKGNIFLSNFDNPVIREIDESEGCTFILYLCSLNRKATRKAFLKDWGEYLKTNSNYRQESVIKDALRRRLMNLFERQLVSREGNSYDISEKGEKYLEKFRDLSIIPEKSDEVQLTKDVEQFNKRQKENFKKELYKLTPTKFENLIKDLLDAMGYEDVQVTAPTNDKGVDVVGSIQNGITLVKEVIQIKRLTSNVQRPVLDALRGSLHRFDAFQGTIITLSNFSKGTKEAAFERGAAPITLINGEKLIELLIENEIAVKKKQIDYFLIDGDYFVESDEEVE
ncbi:restriction endonuclease [candidate division KSB1 bacterium]|nr:restriction endonuclease [candidate division KSB1 bacterium]